MRYHFLHIKTSFEEEWQQDIFDQELAHYGIDTIVAKGSAFDGYESEYYLPSEKWEQNKNDIEAFVARRRNARLIRVESCPDRNWNAAWEAEHPVQELPMGVRIVPHCAFGAGHHETTSMMIDELMARDLSGLTVLDNGCGTGVLAIMAAKRGAERVVAVDIDDKSVVNTRENAAMNGAEIDVRLGDTPPCGSYDLILSNIHRNILLAQMPVYAQCLRPDGELWLSGFLADDCPALCTEAERHGLQFLAQHTRGEWQMLQFRK
ncbi:MAG: 50S ribosomal protein L11 methyltransferase [Paludibacteraceae bacterium]|nr:50S ribosomal protein L11 methyltransferase [Paludibacteraceae bacterium]